MSLGAWSRILEIASRIADPTTALVFTCTIAAMLVLASLLWVKGPSKALAIMFFAGLIVIAGSLPLLASVILKREGLYRIGVVVLNPDGQPARHATIIPSAGEVSEHERSSWEVSIAPPVRPADGNVIIYASVKDSYLAGTSTVNLGGDYFPQVTIQLKPLPSVVLRGAVELPDGGSAAGARVSVIGYPDEAVTDAMGNFALPSHVANGQMVTVRAEMGGLEAQYTSPAGSPLTLRLRKP